MEHETAYGLWSLVIINILVFLMFAFSFTRPRTARDWRSYGAFSAFVIAFFVEMYGFPFTMYLLAGWLGSYAPGLNPWSHEAGHRWHTLLGLEGNPHLDPLHLLSAVLVLGGFVLLSSAWEVLYKAQRTHTLATTGAVQVSATPAVRGVHSDYDGFLAPVADDSHAVDVSGTRCDVCAACTQRGARGHWAIRRRLRTLCSPYPGLHSSSPESLTGLVTLAERRLAMNVMCFHLMIEW